MNPNWDITAREGWEDIARVVAKGKSFTVTFKPKRAFYNWEGIAGNQCPACPQGRRPGLQQALV